MLCRVETCRILYEMDERTKKILDAEKDPEVLKALLHRAFDHINSQKQLIEKLEAEKLLKDQQSFVIEEQIKLVRRSLYKSGQETRLEASDRARDKSQEEALLFSQAMFPSPESRESGKDRFKALESITIDHELSASELEAESKLRGINNPSGEQWQELTNVFDTVTKIQIIERKYVKEIHRKKKYKLKAEFTSETNEKDVIITAGGPSSLLPGMNYSTDFVASVVADKYISHMPLERQTREMESLGLKGIKNSTLSRFSALAAASLEGMQDDILLELRQTDLALHIDETPWKIQNKKENDGYMWVISNRSGSYYFFKPTRSAKVISEKLLGYSGPVVTDGFNSYDHVLVEAKIPHAYCWAHARREFLPLEDHDPTVKPILDVIDKIFEVEREAKDFVQLKLLREEKSKALSEELKSLLMSEYPRSREGSQKRKAILYLQKRWGGFAKFLEDTRIPLSNNEAERTIRHAVMGRKNYYGSGSFTGAETAATLFTVIESCKKNDLDPRTFIVMSLHRAANGENLETPLAYARRTRSASQPA